MSSIRRVLEPLLPAGRFTRLDRQIVVIVWVAGVIQGFGQSQAGATLPFTRAGLGLTEGEMSLLLGLARLAGFVALLIGWLGDHRGRRRPFLWAVTLVVVGGAGAGLAFEAWQFGLAQALARTGTAACSALAVVILAETVSTSIRAYAISFYGAAVSFGSGLALMTLPLAEGGGQSWRVPHLLVGLGLLALPILVKRVPETRVYTESAAGGHWGELLTGVWARRFWTVVVINFLASAYGTVGAAFSTERLIADLGLTTGSTVLILLLGGTLGGVGFFVGGHLSDRWGRRPTSILSLVLALTGGIVLFTTTSVPIIVVAAMISAFGTFSFVPSGGSHRAELFPTRIRSSANTAAINAAMAGSALGLIAGSTVIDRLGLSGYVYVLGVGVALAAALTSTLPETRGQDLNTVGIAR